MIKQIGKNIQQAIEEVQIGMNSHNNHI